MRYRLLITLLFCCISIANTSAQESWRIRKICNWQDSTGVIPNRAGQRYNEVWGFTMHGKEYAAIGSTMGVHIIDVDLCKEVAFYKGRHQIDVTHRDFKTYKHYLYAVCDQGVSTLQIFDLRYLPDSLHLVYESDPYELMLVHNIFIDTGKATLYAASARDLLMHYDFMRVYSLDQPDRPELITKFNLNATVHDVFVRNDTAYCSSSLYGFEIVDFSSRDSNWYKFAELKNYAYQGYNHSSWINETGIGVMADETHGLPLKVIDTRNLQNIRVLSTFMPREDTTCIPHNPFLIGNTAYISYYFDGLQMYDITDPYHPVRIGYYDTHPGTPWKGFAGAWGCYPFLPSGRILVSDMQTGLYIFDVSEALGKHQLPDPEHPQIAIYPDPVQNQLKLYLPDAQPGPVDWSLYDMQGKKVQGGRFIYETGAFQPIRLTLSGSLSPGMYVFTLRNGSRSFTSRISKL